MTKNLLLVDRVGNQHERKNLYERERLTLLQLTKTGTPDEVQQAKAQLDALEKNKSSHPYLHALQEFQKEEKAHMERKKKNRSSFQVTDRYPKKLQNLEREYADALADVSFYAPYRELTHDAELAYQSANVVVERVPEILTEWSELQEEIRALDLQATQVKPEEARAYLSDHSVFAVDRKKIGKARIAEIRTKQKEGDLSRKAAELEIKKEKKAMNDEIHAHRMLGPISSINDRLEALRHKQNKEVDDKILVMKSDISDFRKNIPEETDRSRPIIAYATALLPGLGQLLNRQYMKALLFFLGSLFVYGIAIPYALGYGNFQGEGIAGLVSLAEGGLRVHRSLFFMIEGIIAIFLLLIAAVILILSFRDVLTVEKNAILGVRRQNWFESARTIRLEGFPYLVNLPALILILFIVLVPTFTMILLSFTNMDPQHQSKFQWAGLMNYKIIATGQGIAGQSFWRILGWTLIWTALATSLAIFIGFTLALLANNERVKGKTFFRVVYILPWAVPAFITIMFFSIMFSPQGMLTTILSNLFGTAIQVKTDTVLTRIVLILLQGWLGSSYIFLLSTGVLQGIPSDLYEAADIDGATPWQQTTRITLPLVLFQTAPLLVGQFTFNFNNFSIIYLFNQGGPFNPLVYGNLAGSSDLLISYIFKLTIENQQQAIGAAITMIVSLGLMFFAFLGFRNSKAFKEERL